MWPKDSGTINGLNNVMTSEARVLRVLPLLYVRGVVGLTCGVRETPRGRTWQDLEGQTCPTDDLVDRVVGAATSITQAIAAPAPTPAPALTLVPASVPTPIHRRHQANSIADPSMAAAAIDNNRHLKQPRR
jgi:hypothetical protein